jgi:DNA-binding transcriptional ArsR family regulator
MSDTEPSTQGSSEARELDLASLRALAHPLRVQLFDQLATYGSFTASGLAERLNESSGATSYHLRQLEKHGLVREVEGKGSGRERWWERVPGSIVIGSEETAATPAGRSAADAVFRQRRYLEDRLLNDYAARSQDELTREWRDASTMSTINARLTVEQLAELTQKVMEMLDTYVRDYRDQKTPGTRPVHVTFNAFPVMDADS